MATVKWLGSEGDEDMKETTWKGVVFKKGEAVEVKDEYILDKASGNRFFEVSGYTKPEPPPVEDPLLHPAPSTLPAQYPVPKPGEPVRPEAPKPAVTPHKAEVVKPKFSKV